MTEAMQDRAVALAATWKDEGDGYFSISGYGPGGPVAYVALPEGHAAIGKHYDDFAPDVNGGLTFGEGNVFGWDYAHYQNYGSPETDIPSALDYFRAYVPESVDA